METSKTTIILAVITIVGGWGTAAITNFDTLFPGATAQEKPDEIIGRFPAEVRAASLDETLSKNQLTFNKLSSELNTAQQTLASTQSRLRGVEQEKDKLIQRTKVLEEKSSKLDALQSKFLFRLLEFHNHTICYGDTLNFTRGNNRENCLTKEALASHFIEFLVELELAKETENKTRETAKKLLIELQKQHRFTKVGWYSADIFKILVKESQNKT